MPRFKDKHEEAAFYAWEAPRAMAVGLGALVENRLTDVLRLSMRPDEAVANELFQVSGALGNFGTKVRLGYMLSLFDKDFFRDLLIVNKIRNAFAHDLAITSFDVQPVTDFIASLNANKIHRQLYERLKAELREDSPNADKTKVLILRGDLETKVGQFRMCARFYLNSLNATEERLLLQNSSPSGPQT